MLTSLTLCCNSIATARHHQHLTTIKDCLTMMYENEVNSTKSHIILSSTGARSIMAFAKNDTTSAGIKGAIIVPYLNTDERPMANSLHGSPIDVNTTPSSSTPSTKGKFQKVEGLVFDTAFPHFEPTKWKYSISKDVDCIDLELCSERYNGIDNFETNLLHVHRHQGCDT